MIFKTFGICLTFFFTLGLIANWNNKAVWLWSWLDLYFKDLYFKVYAPVVLLQHIRSFIERKETLRILLTQHIGLLDHYTVSIHLRQSLKSLGKFEFDGHRTHEHAVTHRSL